MTDEERAATKRGDEIDEIDTTDLEKATDSEHEYSSDEDGDTIHQADHIKEFEDSRINLARLFLGYDGGYTIRKLKKFYKQINDGDLNEDGDIEREDDEEEDTSDEEGTSDEDESGSEEEDEDDELAAEGEGGEQKLEASGDAEEESSEDEDDDEDDDKEDVTGESGESESGEEGLEA